LELAKEEIFYRLTVEKYHDNTIFFAKMVKKRPFFLKYFLFNSLYKAAREFSHSAKERRDISSISEKCFKDFALSLDLSVFTYFFQKWSISNFRHSKLTKKRPKMLNCSLDR